MSTSRKQSTSHKELSAYQLQVQEKFLKISGNEYGNTFCNGKRKICSTLLMYLAPAFIYVKFALNTREGK